MNDKKTMVDYIGMDLGIVGAGLIIGNISQGSNTIMVFVMSGLISLIVAIFISDSRRIKENNYIEKIDELAVRCAKAEHECNQLGIKNCELEREILKLTGKSDEPLWS